MEAQARIHNTGESMEMQIAEFEKLDPYMLDNDAQVQQYANSKNLQDYEDYAVQMSNREQV